MDNSSNEQRPSLFSAIAKRWRNWWGNRAGRSELDTLDRSEMNRIARDVGASSEELQALAGKWPDSADLLIRRMGSLQLDPLAVARSQPAVSNDLKKLCSLCVSKGECAHDLDTSAADSHWEEYCPNTTTLKALSAQRAAEAAKQKEH